MKLFRDNVCFVDYMDLCPIPFNLDNEYEMDDIVILYDSNEIALGLGACNVIFNSFNLKDNIKKKNYYEKEKLHNKIDNEEQKELKKGF